MELGPKKVQMSDMGVVVVLPIGRDWPGDSAVLSRMGVFLRRQKEKLIELGK